VDFNRYTMGQTFLGLTAFVLDNLTQDPSGVRETVTMKLFATMGIPAPREAHTRLYVNGAFAGVYVNVEEVNKQMLARVFGSIGDDVQNDGGLFEFNFVAPWRFEYLGPDLEQYKLRFSAKTEEKKPDVEKYTPIETFVRLANELPPERFMSELGPWLDLPGLMRYVGAQNYVAQNDGFLGYDGMNNFYLYRLEETTRHVFIAWDEDNAFAFPDFSITHRHDENVVFRKAMQVPELRDAYYQGIRDARRFADEPTGPDRLPWLEFEIRRQLDLIVDAMREDRFRPYTFDTHEAARNFMIQFAQARSRFVSEALSEVP
jgi:spore coat protein CotH